MPEARSGDDSGEAFNWLAALGLAAVVGPPVVRALGEAVRRVREASGPSPAQAPIEEAVAGVTVGVERAKRAHAVLATHPDEAVKQAIGLATKAVRHGAGHLQEGQAGLLGEFAALALLAGAPIETVEKLYTSICSSGPWAPA